LKKGGEEQRRENGNEKKSTVEEVKEIRYLEYMLQKNGGAEKHIRKSIRRDDSNEKNMEYRREDI